MKYRTFLATIILFIFHYSFTKDYNLYNFDESITPATLEDLEIKTGKTNQAHAMNKPYVVMVSLDGFRWDYPELHNAKNLQSMMSQGSYVERLIPSFPSKTFPNHYTLATGLYPANHGLIGNTFYSRSKGDNYSLGNRDAVEDGSWYGGTPLWLLAEQQGMLAASFFWVGSEADIKGEHASYHFKYNGKIPYHLRVEKVKRWLELPEATRPHIIFLYFSLTDSAGHSYGPEAPETGEAVRYVDELIGELRNCIQQSDLPINLIVTADHGMTEVTNTINVGDYADLKENRFVSGPMAMIYTDSEAETERIYQELMGHKHFSVYHQDGLPSYLNFSNPDRIGDLVIVTDPPNVLMHWNKNEAANYYSAIGTHGYDPFKTVDMSAIFIAEGPGVRSGLRLAPVENIHVYPFVASLLQLTITDAIDGKADKLAPLLND